jgi:hypothetical protein
VDLANGTYQVAVTMGEVYAYDQIAIDLEGQRAGVVDTTGNKYTTVTYTVTVSDGQLTFKISDLGGANPYWVLNSLTITPR